MNLGTSAIGNSIQVELDAYLSRLGFQAREVLLSCFVFFCLRTPLILWVGSKASQIIIAAHLSKTNQTLLQWLTRMQWIDIKIGYLTLREKGGENDNYPSHLGYQAEGASSCFFSGCQLLQEQRRTAISALSLSLSQPILSTVPPSLEAWHDYELDPHRSQK